MINNSEPLQDDHYGEKVKNAIYFFWAGFILYSLSYTISTSESVNYIVCQVLQIVGLISIVSSSLVLDRWEFDSTYQFVIFSLYILWSFFTVIRGFKFTYKFFKFTLFDGTFGVFLYFAPVILLFPRRLVYYKKVFTVIVILGLAYIIYDILFINKLLFPGRNLQSQAIIEYFSLHLSLPCGFLLMTFIYHSRKKILLALAVIAVTFILASIRARRGLMFMSVSILAISFFIFYYANKLKLIVFIFSLILLISVYFVGASVYNKNQEDLFGYITERLDENTRSGVERYFFRDMTEVDWAIGRGINGEYYCPGIDSEGFTVFRGVIETGFLQIILKGGIISLLLLLLITIPAVYKGFFHSNNILTKAAGIWIFLFLIDQYPASLTAFSLNYLLVWMSVGICYSKDLREMSDDDIIRVLSEKDGISGTIAKQRN